MEARVKKKKAWHRPVMACVRLYFCLSTVPWGMAIFLRHSVPASVWHGRKKASTLDSLPLCVK